MVRESLILIGMVGHISFFGPFLRYLPVVVDARGSLDHGKVQTTGTHRDHQLFNNLTTSNFISPIASHCRAYRLQNGTSAPLQSKARVPIRSSLSLLH